MTKASLIASLITDPSPSGAELAALPGSVNWLEVRADLVGDLDPDWLRSHFKGRLLYSLRSQSEGGACADSLDQRHRRLTNAARVFDRIELEGARDLTPELLSAIPVEKRQISWHGPANGLAELKERFSQLSSVPAQSYKLVNRAEGIGDELMSLCLLKSLQRSDTISYSIGPLGFWSRVVALQLGAPAIFGLVPNGRVQPAKPTINKLIEDYGLPTLRPVTKLFAIIGNPIFHSLSPRLHNAAYRAMNYPALFVPLHVDSFSEFWHQVVEGTAFKSLDLPFAGLTVASPHKESALLTARQISPIARGAESVNILVRQNGHWNADTTDPDIVFMANRERGIQMTHKRAAVIGCGGAGRAIAVALDQAGADVTLINRGPERGNHAAELLGLPYIPLREFDAGGYGIIVNATPVGRDDDDVPFKLERMDEEVVIIDLVYGSRVTPLVANSLAREQIAIDGRDVLVTQVLRQFRIMTGKEMPVGVALEALGRRSAAVHVSGQRSFPN